MLYASADHLRRSASALGVVAGLRPGWVDTSTLVTSAISAAIPSFVASIVLITLFAVKLGWFPALGNGHRPVRQQPAALHAARGRARALLAGDRGPGHQGGDPGGGRPRARADRDQPRHPARGSSSAGTSCATRPSRSPRSPAITIASLIAVAAVVETAFGLNGLGAYLVQAAQSKDLAVVQGISLVLVSAFVVINLSRSTWPTRCSIRGSRRAGGPDEQESADEHCGASSAGHGQAFTGPQRDRPSARHGPAGIASAVVIAVATVLARDRAADRSLQPERRPTSG